MDLKELNKPQLILLAVLLSFVTSIATGIVTVTLMQQAPVSFTTPVNRVIKQTVEKIQQVEGKTTVQTIIVKEEDLVVDAIEKNKSALFTLTKEIQDVEFKTTEVSAGRGFAISLDGYIVADAFAVSEKGVYYAKNESGKFKADFIHSDKAGFSILKIENPVNGTDKISFIVPVSGDLSKMKIGQKILILGGSISSFIFEGLNANKNLDINTSKSNTGGLVLNLDGEALGVALYSDVSSFASIKTINDTLASLIKTEKTDATKTE